MGEVHAAFDATLLADGIVVDGRHFLIQQEARRAWEEWVGEQFLQFREFQRT